MVENMLAELMEGVEEFLRQNREIINENRNSLNFTQTSNYSPREQDRQREDMHRLINAIHEDQKTNFLGLQRFTATLADEVKHQLLYLGQQVNRSIPRLLATEPDSAKLPSDSAESGNPDTGSIAGARTSSPRLTTPMARRPKSLQQDWP
ncbi:hypothetical protein CMQ_2379 [Grosmannia clavigera kw1407]|uniref:Uncharacterized protein n=1 Tax=Grosmannia clavigera (strain kw1407 / UAMH 11150) TaxID=655863 RepID=F0XJV5_GROCL|nr:uncharacterized protein CMQ_2379 [Grosmannia clavigera kw1407]EFX02330.1 hypothetical protein CMQ_2379 [Grosmannia clavigera kw1407]